MGESARCCRFNPTLALRRVSLPGPKSSPGRRTLPGAVRALRAVFDETVLLNERGQVAECTSANIFVVAGNGVSMSSLLTDGCLAGITREVLLNELKLPQVCVAERSLTLDDLYGADGVFITSTTRDLLPVREIAGRTLNHRSDIRECLAEAFRNFVQSDIRSRTSMASSLILMSIACPKCGSRFLRESRPRPWPKVLV